MCKPTPAGADANLSRDPIITVAAAAAAAAVVVVVVVVVDLRRGGDGMTVAVLVIDG